MGDVREVCGSSVIVAVTVGGIISSVAAGIMVAVLAGRGVDVESTIIVGVALEQEDKKIIVKMNSFFITLPQGADEPVLTGEAVSKDIRPNFHGVEPTKFNAYSASSYPGRTDNALRQALIAPFKSPSR